MVDVDRVSEKCRPQLFSKILILHETAILRNFKNVLYKDICFETKLYSLKCYNIRLLGFGILSLIDLPDFEEYIRCLRHLRSNDAMYSLVRRFRSRIAEYVGDQAH